MPDGSPTGGGSDLSQPRQRIEGLDRATAKTERERERANLRRTSRWFPGMATQFNSHRQAMIADRFDQEKRTWVRIGDMPDDLWDCICQDVVSGCMAGILKKEQ